MGWLCETLQEWNRTCNRSWKGYLITKPNVHVLQFINISISFPDRLCNYEGGGNLTGILCNSIIGCDKRSRVVCNDQYECDDRSDENQLLFDCGKYRKSILS